FYNEDDLGFYYDVAKLFALSDRHFSSVLGSTFPNRSYLMAATSFDHLTTSEEVPDITKAPFLFYRPLTGTIFNLFDQHGVSWANYFQDVPQATSFRNFLADPLHFRFVSKPGRIRSTRSSRMRRPARCRPWPSSTRTSASSIRPRRTTSILGPAPAGTSVPVRPPSRGSSRWSATAPTCPTPSC